LDVEVLAELREELIELLEADGKLGFAEEEFAGILAAGIAPPRVDPWRKTSGLHQIRDRRQLAAVRELWQERDQLARKRDVAPGRLIPDSALVAAAKALPTTVPQLLATKGFHGRSAQREAPRWLRCITTARTLTELREELIELLQADGKLEYAEQEFAAILEAGIAPPRVDPWRKTSGLHQIRDRRQLAAVRELWLERDSLAQKRDVAPGRLIPDSALVAAAKAMPATVPQLLSTKGFHGRAAQREAPRWLRCIAAARDLEELPPLHLPTNAPPPPRVWADRDPEAAARLATARPLLQAKAEELNLPLENLLTPDYLRRVAWRPPADLTEDSVAAELRALGARRWQVELSAPLIAGAFLNPQPLPPKEAKPVAAAGGQ
jgi:ribonuclease D